MTLLFYFFNFSKICALDILELIHRLQQAIKISNITMYVRLSKYLQCEHGSIHLFIAYFYFKKLLLKLVLVAAF